MIQHQILRSGGLGDGSVGRSSCCTSTLAQIPELMQHWAWWSKSAMQRQDQRQTQELVCVVPESGGNMLCVPLNSLMSGSLSAWMW